MKNALIGFTGFIGSTLARQAQFDDLFNSTNIDDICGRHYASIVCAGAPGIKWKANKFPDEDRASIQALMTALKKTTCEHFILISTIDVYKTPLGVSESTPIITEGLHPYGLHRYELEVFVRQHFTKTLSVRLPAVFGTGLRKNFIFDLLHQNALHLTDCRSAFQFYNLAHLWQDVQTVLPHPIDRINLATPPVTTAQVAKTCFGIDFTNQTEQGAVFYDMHTDHAALFGKSGNYLCTLDEELAQIKAFVAAYDAGEPA